MQSETKSRDPEAESENPFPESAKVNIFIQAHASKNNEEAMGGRSEDFTAESRATLTDTEKM